VIGRKPGEKKPITESVIVLKVMRIGQWIRWPRQISMISMTYHFRHALVNHKGATSGKVGAGKANRIGDDWRCVTLRIGLLPEDFYVRILFLPF
jgi:hypothetical protein